MKTVIFGAGASYDCIKSFNKGFGEDRQRDYRPPLTRDLFQLIPWYEKLQGQYPGVRALLSKLNGVSDVEAYLQEKWAFAERHDDKVLGATLINMQFYLQMVLHTCSREYLKAGPTNYDDLVQSAHEYATRSKEPVLMVSFNYDLFLEDAIRKWYHRLSDHLSIEEYISSPIKLIKPHGSCNWYRPLRKGFIAGKGRVSQLLYNSNIGLKEITSAIDGDFVAFKGTKDVEAQYPLYQERMLYPQIIIPLKTKDDLVLPTKHHACLVDCLKQTTQLLVIGWKAQEERFLSLMEEHLGGREVKIDLVCRSSGRAVRETLQQRLPSANIEVFDQAIERLVNRNYQRPDEDEYEILIDSGSFSSYVHHVARGKWPDFFAA